MARARTRTERPGRAQLPMTFCDSLWRAPARTYALHVCSAPGWNVVTPGRI
jgi:hypothetical protein